MKYPNRVIIKAILFYYFNTDRYKYLVADGFNVSLVPFMWTMIFKSCKKGKTLSHIAFQNGVLVVLWPAATDPRDGHQVRGGEADVAAPVARGRTDGVAPARRLGASRRRGRTAQGRTPSGDVRLSSTEWLVFIGFTSFDWVLPCSPGCFLVLLAFTSFCWFSTGVLLVLPSFTGFYLFYWLFS